ncbi:MAG: TolC family protein [Deltaproteobacteria bacterium]|nr:TolC family protein [Deltaproteobacteria bacterium]
MNARRAEVAATRASIIGLPERTELQLAVGPRIGGDGTDLDASIGLSQTFDVSGTNAARERLAKRVAGRVDAEIASTLAEARARVTAAFAEALAARLARAVAARAAAFAAELRVIATNRVRAGDGVRSDLRLAEADAILADADLAAAERAVQTTRIALAIAAGWPTETPPEPADDALPPAPDFATLRARLDDHPSLLALRARRAELAARRTVLARAGASRPAFGVELSREGSPGPELAQWIVLATATFQLGTVDPARGEVASLTAEAEILTAEEAATRAQLDATLALAWNRLEAAKAREASLSAAHTPLDAALADLRQALTAGELSLTELAVVRERVLALEGATNAARAETLRARAGLEAVLANTPNIQTRTEPTP